VCNTIQLSEMCDFRVSAFCQVVQKHKLFEVAYKRLLIAHFIGNISAKKYQNPFMCVKVIASQRWDIFLRHGVVGVLYSDGRRPGGRGTIRPSPRIPSPDPPVFVVHYFTRRVGMHCGVTEVDSAEFLCVSGAVPADVICHRK